jgi:hypothetical protein
MNRRAIPLHFHQINDRRRIVILNLRIPFNAATFWTHRVHEVQLVQDKRVFVGFEPRYMSVRREVLALARHLAHRHINSNATLQLISPVVAPEVNIFNLVTCLFTSATCRCHRC